MKKIVFSQTQNVELFVKEGNPMGGAVVETFVWMKAIDQLGFLVYQFREGGDNREIEPDFSWIKMVTIFDPKKGLKWLRWAYYRFPFIYKKLKEVKPHFFYESIPSWSTYFSILICRSLGIKVILRVANDNMLDERIFLTHSKFEQNLINRSFALADYILPQNKFQFERLRENFPDRKIKMLYNPFILSEQFSKAKSFNVGYIAWVANFRYQKNMRLLYDIASTLPQMLFKVAGQVLPNPDEETWMYLDKLKTLDNVEFVGVIKRDDILQFFEQSMFLLNTSRYEGFSNTFLEAMATGTPILTTHYVNPDNIIDEFNLGFIYNGPDDLKSFFGELKAKDYEALSENCVNYITKFHGHLEIGKNLIEFLEQD